MTELTGQVDAYTQGYDKGYKDGYKYGLGAFFNEITNCKDLIGINNVEYLFKIYAVLLLMKQGSTNETP